MIMLSFLGNVLSSPKISSIRDTVKSFQHFQMLKADLFLIFPPLLVTFYIFSNKANVLFLSRRKTMPFITGTWNSMWKRANTASWPLSLESSAASVAGVWELGFHEFSHDFLSDEYSSLCLHHADNEVHVQHSYSFWVWHFSTQQADGF